MTEPSKDLDKLINLHVQRPSFSRMISWEMGRTREPAKKTKQKKKKVLAESQEDAGGCEAEVFAESGDSSEYETAEEDLQDLDDQLRGTSITSSSSESLDNVDTEEVDDLLMQSCSSTISSPTDKTFQTDQSQTGGRRRRLSKKQKRKRKAHMRTCYLEDFYNLGNLYDVSDDIENVFSEVAEMGACANVQRRMPTLVELCLIATRKKQRIGSDSRKTRALSCSIGELPRSMRRQIRSWESTQQELQRQLSYLQNHVLPMAVNKDNKLVPFDTHSTDWSDYIRLIRRSVFSAIASPNCGNCATFCEKPTEFLVSGSVYNFSAYENLCYNCSFSFKHGVTPFISFATALGTMVGEFTMLDWPSISSSIASHLALATTIDLMLPVQIVQDASRDWQTDRHFKTVIFRVRRALSLRYKLLVDRLFDIVFPYVLWARGYVTIATDMFKSLVVKETDSATKAMYLSEIAHMHAQFGDAEKAVKFFRLASETALEEIPPSKDREINEVSEQLQILLANVYDTGILDSNKAVMSNNYWSGARNLPKTRTATAVASLDAFLCYHAANWEGSNWYEEVESKVHACEKEHPYLMYYLSLVYAIRGVADTSERLYRQCRLMSLNPPGGNLLRLLGRNCYSPWKPLLDTINTQKFPVSLLKVVWRSELTHPRLTSDPPTEAQLHSNNLNLHLNENGHVTGDMQMLLPPLRNITLDPYTGALLLNNVPSYTGTWVSGTVMNDSHTELFLPTPVLVYSNDSGTTVHMVQPCKDGIKCSRFIKYQSTSPAPTMLYWRDEHGRKARLNLLTILKDVRKKELTEHFTNARTGTYGQWTDEKRKMALHLLDMAYKQNIKMDRYTIENIVNRIGKPKKETKKKPAKYVNKDKNPFGVSPVNESICLMVEPFVFSDTIVFKVMCNTNYLIFVRTKDRESFLSYRVVSVTDSRYKWFKQGHNNVTDSEFFMMFLSNSIQIFDDHGHIVNTLGPELGRDWHPAEPIIIGPYIYCFHREDRNSIWRFLAGIEEETSLEDNIVWSLAPYVEELSATNRIVELKAVGKASKLILLVMDKGIGVMSPVNMDLLSLCIPDNGELSCDLTADSKVIKGEFTDYRLLEETLVVKDNQSVSRLCVGYQNKLLVLDLDPEATTVHLKTHLILPGFPKDMCFVGKQHLLVSVTQHDSDHHYYREHVLHYDLKGHIHGFLPCLGHGSRSFLPVYLYGEQEGEERQAGWHVYMRDGRGGILCVRLIQ